MDEFEERQNTEPAKETEAATEIDPHEIAERVYRLLCAEIRLERARGETAQ